MQRINTARLAAYGMTLAFSLSSGLAGAQSHSGGQHGGSSQGGSPTQGMQSMPSGGAHGQGSDAMHRVMMNGMKQMQAMPMTGDTDKDFAMMMKMHHQMAIDMAQVQMSSGKSSEMKSMARKMSGEQKKDINSLNRWLNKHQ